MWFWIAAIFAVLWNLVGAGTYLADVTMSSEALSNLPEGQRNLREATPIWVTGAYAIAVFAGLCGAIALILRKAAATPLLTVSVIAVIVQMGFVFVGMNAMAVLGPGAMIFPAIIIIIGILLVWFSMSANQKGWIR